MNGSASQVWAFAVTMAACVTLILFGHTTPAALTEYAAILTGLYSAWHNRHP
ncbi:hypothetical protein [Streptomyces cinnamoneus]|uniref:hypothetical protein n=1 Tax=Streptomyces cinnamoneus TaxID=53446 RepID=UPI0015E367CD|nr:hypothetical protein [Streptomyces cinnamoneus]